MHKEPLGPVVDWRLFVWAMGVVFVACAVVVVLISVGSVPEWVEPGHFHLK